MARNREDIVVVALAAAGPSAAFDPIRLQTLLFLIDQVVSERVGGPFFRFAPYHYGPFDQGIYDVIRAMVAAGDARVDASGPYPRHSLTQAGRRRGEAALASFPAPVASYFRRVARWMLLTPYRRMLAAIWREYPEMAVNSVIPHSGEGRPAQPQNPFVRGMARAFDPLGTVHRLPDSEVGLESDAEGIGDIWRTVGDDLEDAMVGFAESERLWRASVAGSGNRL